MKLLRTFFGRLPSALYYLENPRLLWMAHSGVIAETYQKLNQPWFKAMNINTVLDIGANVGRFSMTLHKLLPHANIYAFEPLPDCFNELLKRMRSVPNFTAFQCGLGDQPGEFTMQRSAHSPSSSLLRMANAHIEAFPFTKETSSVRVKVERLDSLKERLAIRDEVLVKLDVQGYEDRVMRGGEATIRRAKLIVIEASFIELYEGQPLFANIYQQLTDLGFRFSGIVSQMSHPSLGHPLDADCLFTRVDNG